jgi:uncharacterized protein involved in response to NO
MPAISPAIPHLPPRSAASVARAQYTGLPVLRQAFRICFLAAALWAIAAVPVWLFAYAGWIDISGTYNAVDWHAHELIFGYVALVLCGFLFTAIPNWTGRLPFSGWPLAGLVAVWAAGRVAMLTAGIIGPLPAAVIDAAFLLVVLLAAAREVIAGKNWRNLPVLALVFCLVAGNVFFHAANFAGQSTGMSLRLSIGALIALITLVGGRITPSFTHNYLNRHKASALPAPFSRYDLVAMVAAVVTIVAWIAAPDNRATAVAAAIVAVLLAIRLWRWRGWLAWREPLVVVLHVGYAFVAIGFALVAAATLWPAVVPASGALHAWTVGAIGTMTLAVMTRASLGHTGHALTAGPGTMFIYAAILTAAVLRVAAPFSGEAYMPLLAMAGTAWVVAFATFVILYGPILVAARPKAAPGRPAAPRGG